MMTFWIIAAAMMLAALLWLAPALLRKERVVAGDRDGQNVVIARERLSEIEAEFKAGVLDELQFEQARSELEQALLIDLDTRGDEDVREETPGTGYLALSTLVVLVPALTLAFYFSLGSPELMNLQARAQVPVQGAAHGLGAGSEQGMPSLEDMVSALVQRLEADPGDADGWFLLGRTFMAQKRYGDAAMAFERLHGLVGDQPAALLSWADAQAMQRQGDMSGKPTELVRKAVQLVPDDTTALWLAGMAEEQAGNYQLAVAHWERLQPKLADNPASSQRVKELIATARQKGGLGDTTVASNMPAAVASAPGVRIRVSLAPTLAGQATGDETLFIYARALQGPRMPLAAARLQVKDLPVEIQLDDSQAMTPQMKLSNFEQVVVGARVSRAGGAIAQSGDLRGEVSPVTVGGNGVTEIVIDSVIP